MILKRRIYLFPLFHLEIYILQSHVKTIHVKVKKKKKKKIFDKVEKFSNILNLLGTQPDGSSSIFRRGFPRKRDRRGVSRNCSFQKRRSVIRGADNGSWAGGRTLRSQQRSNVSLPVILIIDREFAVVRYFQRFTGVERK